jgi:hypothetical protein
MGNRYFDPDLQAFFTGKIGPGGAAGTTNVLLLNIFIELQVITQYLAAMNPQVVDSPESLRSDAVQNYTTATT